MHTLESFEALFNAHYGKLCNVAYGIVRNKAAAEDIVQEVFLKAWNKKDELSIHTSIPHYLRKATANASINYLESRRKIVPLNERITSGQTYTSDKLNLKEFEATVSRAIDNLPPKCRAIFLLSRFEGMKYHEIADHLDISPKTVEHQMGKALRQLREELKPFLTREFITAVAIAGLSLLPYFSVLLFLHFIF